MDTADKVSKGKKKAIRLPLAFMAAIGFFVYQLHKYWYRKSAGAIGKRYELLDAVICKKEVYFQGLPCVIRLFCGRTPDGHEQRYMVNKVAFESHDEGDVFPVYHYEGCYHTAAGGVIEQYGWRMLCDNVKTGILKN